MMESSGLSFSIRTLLTPTVSVLGIPMTVISFKFSRVKFVGGLSALVFSKFGAIDNHKTVIAVTYEEEEQHKDPIIRRIIV